jgi:hypothetical protein
MCLVPIYLEWPASPWIPADPSTTSVIWATVSEMANGSTDVNGNGKGKR